MLKEGETVYENCGLWAVLRDTNAGSYTYIVGATPKVKVNATGSGYATVDLDHSSLRTLYRWLKQREKELRLLDDLPVLVAGGAAEPTILAEPEIIRPGDGDAA